MTAVLSATDALRRDRIMSSHDDNQIKYAQYANVCLSQLFILASRPLARFCMYNLQPVSITTTQPIEPPPTPLYNSALLKCTTPRLHLLHTHALIQEVPSFTNALTLLRVWANQRGYNGDYIASENARTGSVARAFLAGWAGRGPWWAALLGVLVNGEEPISDSGRKGAKRKLVARGLSSYQLFRAALDFLSRHEWSSQPVFARTKDSKHRYPPAEYQRYHDAVFVDASSSANLLAGMPLSSLDLLRHDAKVTLDVLGDGISAIDPFAEAFLNDQRDMVTRFDVVLSVDIANAKIHNQYHKALDWGSENSFVINSVCSVLWRALTNRAKAIGLFIQPSETRPVSQANPPPPPSSIIHIGLILDPANAHRLVDHGPALTDANTESDSHEVKVFRELWGKKSELRRFKDGRIQESVVWDVQSSDARAIPTLTCSESKTLATLPNTDSQGVLVLRLMTQLADFGSSIDGTSLDIPTKELSAGARIYYDIRTAIQNSTSPRVGLFVPEAAFDLLVKLQIKLLEAPSLWCVELVHDELVKMCHNCASAELQRFPRLHAQIIEIVSELLRGWLAPTSEYVQTLFAIRAAYINTNHLPFIAGSATAPRNAIPPRPSSPEPINCRHSPFADCEDDSSNGGEGDSHSVSSTIHDRSNASTPNVATTRQTRMQHRQSVTHRRSSSQTPPSSAHRHDSQGKQSSGQPGTSLQHTTCESFLTYFFGQNDVGSGPGGRKGSSSITDGVGSATGMGSSAESGIVPSGRDVAQSPTPMGLMAGKRGADGNSGGSLCIASPPLFSNLSMDSLFNVNVLGALLLHLPQLILQAIL
ncbi:hypothetical protein BD410DRAFT_868973 [Rickenella mellea]|uniref:U3 small nucleolar RNA-associated protein 22 n=1 Tax=Rickenella mellea TaxID=50990 RepID=A0A4Y7PER6_9AGAM|nr:hypothetical protein BD410DRAFT_868973 [Rickenella mellea]